MRSWHWPLPVLAVALGLVCTGAAFAQKYKDVSVGTGSPRVERGQAYTASDFKRMGFYQDVAADEIMPDEKPGAELLPEDKPATKLIPDPKPAEEILPDDMPAEKPAVTGPKKPAAKSPFLEEEEPKKAPTPDKAYDEVPGKPEPLAGADVYGGCAVGCGDIGCDAGCGSACGGRKATFRNRLEDRFGVKIGAWLDQGITANYRGSADRFNGPVTFNDREGEYQMNQAYFFAEKVTKTDGCGWDLGGRADFLYGTDWRFIQSQGLEDQWNSERFYGAALPQVYADVAFNDWIVRMGKFNTIMGYEVIGAPGNFFYSHSYMMQYAEPMTQTGLLASRKLGDTLVVSGGFDRGWDKWEDNNDRLEFLGKIAWTSCDQRTSLAFALTSGAWDDAGELNRTAYSLVFTHKFNAGSSTSCSTTWAPTTTAAC